MTNEARSPNEGSIGSCVLPSPAAPESDRQKCGSQHAGSVRSQILHHLSIVIPSKFVIRISTFPFLYSCLHIASFVVLVSCRFGRQIGCGASAVVASPLQGKGDGEGFSPKQLRQSNPTKPLALILSPCRRGRGEEPQRGSSISQN